MKKPLFLVSLIFLFLLVISNKNQLFSESSNFESSKKKDYGYRYLTVDRFYEEAKWKVKYSKYRSKYWDTDFFYDKNIKDIPAQKWIKWIKSDNSVEYSNKYILPPTTYNKEIFDNSSDSSIISVRGEWDKADINWLFIYPSDVRVSEEYYTGIKDIIVERYSKDLFYKNKNYIIMPSQILDLKVFVWSIGYPYKIEAHFDDHLGNSYVVNSNQDLGFHGWKEITFTIPKNISQEDKFIPKVRPLKFLGFKIITSFKDPYKGFFAYFDHIRAKTIINNEEFLGHYLKREDIYWNRKKALEELSSSNENSKLQDTAK